MATASNIPLCPTIGITGGIGAGKSSLCAILRSWGYPVWDADDFAKEALQKPFLISQVQDLLGPDTVLPSGQCDRSVIAQKIFHNPPLRKAFEGLLHPVIAQIFHERHRSFSTLAPRAWLFYEASLIMEAGRTEHFDAVVLVRASEQVRHTRLKAHRNLGDAHIQGVMTSQWTDEKKSRYAHFIIDNEGTKDDLLLRTKELLEELRKYFLRT